MTFIVLYIVGLVFWGAGMALIPYVVFRSLAKADRCCIIVGIVMNMLGLQRTLTPGSQSDNSYQVLFLLGILSVSIGLLLCQASLRLLHRWSELPVHFL